eukprot:GHVS01036326.1.p1 GENE.GHVS01036326.1~~GHVS01036326.1.p1  ORF type:complete len:120 (-),score=18.40 GHVS01036326.1:708-1067(-)
MTIQNQALVLDRQTNAWFWFVVHDVVTPEPRQAGEIMDDDPEPSVGPPVDRKRDQWKPGEIKNLLRGRDGQVPVVRIRCRGVDVDRPVVKLYPIELSRKEEEEEEANGAGGATGGAEGG